MQQGRPLPGPRRSSSVSIVLCLIISDLQETPHPPLTVVHFSDTLLKVAAKVVIFSLRRQIINVRRIGLPIICCKFPSALCIRVSSCGYQCTRRINNSSPLFDDPRTLCGRKKGIEYELPHSPRCTCRANYQAVGIEVGLKIGG